MVMVESHRMYRIGLLWLAAGAAAYAQPYSVSTVAGPAATLGRIGQRRFRGAAGAHGGGPGDRQSVLQQPELGFHGFGGERVADARGRQRSCRETPETAARRSTPN